MISKLNMSPSSKELWFNQALDRSNRQKTCFVSSHRNKNINEKRKMGLPCVEDPELNQQLIYSAVDAAASTEWFQGTGGCQSSLKKSDPRNRTGMTRIYQKRFRDDRFKGEAHEIAKPFQAPAFVVSSLASPEVGRISLNPAQENSLDALKRTCSKSIYTTRKQIPASNISTGQDGRPLRPKLSYEDRMALRAQASLEYGSTRRHDPNLRLQASFSTATMSPSMEQINAIRNTLQAAPAMQIFGSQSSISRVAGR
jgi:hypothetical protein